jgi:hypothetical protein
MQALPALIKRAPRLLLAALALLSAMRLCSQTPEDGEMLAKNLLCTGVIYTHDQWDHYWEGSLNRTNGNIGTITTQTINNSSNLALFNRLNIFVTTPFVWTSASQGVLHSQAGFQDISLAVKFQALRVPVGKIGDFSAIAVVSGSVPITNYEPDLQPLSIGLRSKTIAPRATYNFQAHDGIFANGTAAYVFRGIVTLDRPYYYTDGQLYMSNQVAMPNQFQYTISAGYRKHDLLLSGEFIQQQTRGGGDIRRQDMPFISNRMNYSRAGFRSQIPIPKLHNFQVWFADEYTYDGRNVGQSNTISTAIMYTIHLRRLWSK